MYNSVISDFFSECKKAPRGEPKRMCHTWGSEQGTGTTIA